MWPTPEQIVGDENLGAQADELLSTRRREEVWERDDCVRRTIVLATEFAERLAAEAKRRGLSVSDLLIE